MAAPDPVDVRLLTALAETGRAAVHEIAVRFGMDVREVAARLAALSTTGLPLVVGAECDPQGIHAALARVGVTPPAHYLPMPQNPPAPHYPAQGPAPGYWPPPNPHQSGPSGPQQFPPPFQPPGAPQAGMPQGAGTWGPPGSAAWARAGQGVPPQPAGPRTGTIGSKLEAEGPAGERITIQLIEVVDPADSLLAAAGHELPPGERSVVVHTELTNHGPVPFAPLPDQNLLLVTAEGTIIGKSPTTLTSRPPHHSGVTPGETTGGHTVYLLPEDTDLAAVRWFPAAGAAQSPLTWDVTGN